MSAFVRNLAMALAALSAVSGVFVGSLLTAFNANIASTSELRWSLILGMPIVLLASFAWLDQQPAKGIAAVALQSIALVAVFFAPYWWIIRHAV
jgi:hypothetical protein